MKKTIALGLMLTACMATAEVKLVPLDMELGYWETTTKMEESEMMRNLLASIPEAQRAQMREMMQGALQSAVGRQCITADSFKDMEKQMRESMGSEAGPDCQFGITKSTSKEWLGTFTCAGMPSTIHAKVINSRRHESTVVSVVPGVGQNKIISTGLWKSATCPQDLM
ncbi:MAG: hypothetical protein ACJASY_002652 [Halioglobus sp.]